jgi:hypothetical protein
LPSGQGRRIKFPEKSEGRQKNGGRNMKRVLLYFSASIFLPLFSALFDPSALRGRVCREVPGGVF